MINLEVLSQKLYLQWNFYYFKARNSIFEAVFFHCDIILKSKPLSFFVLMPIHLLNETLPKYMALRAANSVIKLLSRRTTRNN